MCAFPDNCLVIVGDVTDEAFVKHLFEQTVSKFGVLLRKSLTSSMIHFPFASIRTIRHGVQREYSSPTGGAFFLLLDYHCQNAGTFVKPVPFEDITLSDFQSVIDVNLTASFLCAREATRVFKRQNPPGGEYLRLSTRQVQYPDAWFQAG